MDKPELLAPAGGWDALVAAVENGADAVYLGGKMFNARQSAANFDDAELSRALEYSHLRGVKVYVTVNTLIADNEVEAALDFLFRLQVMGVDAVIIQDAGLAVMARKVVTELPLHASTQMTAHNAPGVMELINAGFSRVVLAREMSLEEIKIIKVHTGADLEVFIHGALCISYSGQCLLSSMIGGRSGNRGRCAQPCRMRYDLLDQSGRAVAADNPGDYLLSPRDLNMSVHIPELINAGIKSFKLEGRMKRPEYVATVVRVYRDLLDRAFFDQQYFVDQRDKDDLAQIFNREFTTGYFFGAQGRGMMSYKRPNNRGLHLGRVRNFNRETGLVQVALERPLRIGDGVEVWVTEGGRVGFRVGEIFLAGTKVDFASAGEMVSLSIPGRVKPGDRVFKTHDADLMTKASESYISSRTRRKVPLLFRVKAGPGVPLVLTAIDPDGRVVESSTSAVGQPAINRPLNEDFLVVQLSRLGNTPFSMAELSSEIEGQVIYPVKEINEARRAVLTGLEKMILNDRRKPALEHNVFLSRKSRAQLNGTIARTAREYAVPELAVSVGDMGSLRSAVEAGADVIYFGMDLFLSKPPVGKDILREASQFCRKNGTELVLTTPRIVKDNEIESLIEVYANIPSSGVLVGNLGVMSVFAHRLAAFSLVADFGLNVFNRYTVEYLLSHGAVTITLSPELTMSQVKSLAKSYPVEVFIQGALEVMISEHCLPGAVLGGRTVDSPCQGGCRGVSFRLQDRTGAEFPIETDCNCRIHIFNSRDLCMVEDIPELASSGVSRLRIEARRESPQYVAGTVAMYRQVLDGISGRGKIYNLEEARGKLLAFNPAGVTKGHYYRGV